VENVIEEANERERVSLILLRWLDNFPFNQPPPVSAREMYRIFSRETGVTDLYREEKMKATSFLIDRLPQIEEVIEGSENPFESALKFALAGNSIDLAINEKLDLPGVIEKANTLFLPEKMVERLHTRIKGAKTILVIGDNAGETVLDRLFIEQFENDFAQVYYAVRGYPILNDAMRGDAIAAGIPQVAKLLDTGTDVPGIVLEESSPDFRDVFENAELILSKGQGNFETLYPCQRKNLFFLFLVKCPIVSREVNLEIGSAVILEAN
jgi:uncharacterized protein with ATP-grasp and redox domains